LRQAAEASKIKATYDSAIISKNDLERIRTESRLISHDEKHATDVFDSEKRKALWDAAQERKQKL